nr:putative reverse transcriptase domain-containing protein [Tanacetum cinerariifolium]
VGHEAAYDMSWKMLMKMMTDKYCPRNEIRKLEIELWELKVKGTNLATYTQRFQELALLCGRMFSGESDKNTGRVYTTTSGGKKQYGGSKPLCAKCNYHHDGPCGPKCHNYNKIGHSASDCRNVANTNNANNQRGTKLGQKPACYECGVKGHYKRECHKLKNNNNQGNQGGRNNALARVYVVGRVGA